jgi:hypothetical protein
MGKYHTDAMDPTRFVIPIENRGANMLCRVFFRGKNDRLDYAGLAEMPTTLFTGSRVSPQLPDLIGFSLVRE